MKPTKSPVPGTTSPYDNFYDREAEEAVCGAIILESQAVNCLLTQSAHNPYNFSVPSHRSFVSVGLRISLS